MKAKLIDIIFALAFAQGCWFMLAIWRQRFLNPAGQPHLLILIGSLLLIMAEVWLLQSPVLLPFPIAGATAALPLMMGPAFYCYAKSFAPADGSKLAVVAPCYWHYLPAILLTLWQVLAMAGILAWPGVFLVLAKALSLYGYLWISLALLWPATDLLRRRLRQSGVALVTLVSSALLLFIAETTGLHFWPGSDLLAGLSLAVFVYAVSMIVLLDWQNYLLQLQPVDRHPQAPKNQAANNIIDDAGAITGPQADAQVNTSAIPTSITQTNAEAATIERSPKLDPQTARLVYDELCHTVQNGQLWREPQCRLADLSQATGLAEHYLSYVINLQAGCNSQIWINKFRVAAAKHLLAETDMPVLEIGLQVGFNSKATFNRVFKDVTGDTPTALRQASRQQQ